MPRNPRSPEAGILKFFQTADYPVAKLMFGLVQAIVKDRSQAERSSLPKAEPVRRIRNRAPIQDDQPVRPVAALHE